MVHFRSMTIQPARRFFAVFAAYLMVLHALGMGAMAAPVAVNGALFVVCSMDDQAGAPDTPDHAPAQHPPCALCGLGACAAAAPPADSVLAEFAPTAIAILVLTRQPALSARFVVAARPRGPPLVV
jgi:hypothetical protein